MNSGNANACTGEQGIADAREMIALAAAKAGVASEEVAVKRWRWHLRESLVDHYRWQRLLLGFVN